MNPTAVTNFFIFSAYLGRGRSECGRGKDAAVSI